MFGLKQFAVAACSAFVAVLSAPLQAADLTVFSDGPLQTAMVRIVADFQAETKHSVQLVYGTAPALRAKLQAGEQPDSDRSRG